MFNDENEEIVDVEEVEELEEVEEVDDEEEAPQVDWEARAKKAEAILARNKEKKVEKPTVSKPVEKTSVDTPAYSLTDMRALFAVPEEDVAEVEKASRLLGKSIADTLKDPTMKSILATRAEERKTAVATNTRTQRTGQKQISDDEIINRASKGEIPDAGSAEAERLFWARRGGKK